MVELRRTIRCSNCNADNTFYVSSEISLNELQLHGKCRCGNSLQITYNIVEVGQTNAAPFSSAHSGTPSGSDTSNTTQPVNLDDIFFSGQDSSNSLKDIIDG